MRYVLMAQAEEGDGAEPAVRDRAALDRYEQELVRAGVLLAAEALEPVGTGVRIRFDGESPTPDRFPDAGTRVTALWTLQTAGEDEALEWGRRLPLTSGSVEVRRVAGDAGR